jgi:hypothetical protein
MEGRGGGLYFCKYSLPGLIFGSQFLFRSSHLSSVHSIVSYGIIFGVQSHI